MILNRAVSLGRQRKTRLTDPLPGRDQQVEARHRIKPHHPRPTGSRHRHRNNPVNIKTRTGQSSSHRDISRPAALTNHRRRHRQRNRRRTIIIGHHHLNRLVRKRVIARIRRTDLVQQIHRAPVVGVVQNIRHPLHNHSLRRVPPRRRKRQRLNRTLRTTRPVHHRRQRSLRRHRHHHIMSRPRIQHHRIRIRPTILSHHRISRNTRLGNSHPRVVVVHHCHYVT